MHHLTRADYRRMPWRNGGGTTTEILVEREGAMAADRFLHRISIADVASDGPFSSFLGYDRHIMLVEGAGMTLDCGPHGTIDLERPFEPQSFSGDWEVRGTLVNGPVQDFNLIVDRARASSSLEVRRLGAPLVVRTEGIAMIHVFRGSLGGLLENGDPVGAGDTLVVEARDGEVTLVPRASETVLALAHVVPRRG
jgi:environmental stress-induced protein Ves